MTTLEDLIQEAETGNPRPAIEYLSQALKNADQKNISELTLQFKAILDSQALIKDALERLINKPEKDYPQPKDFPEIQKVILDRPIWYKDAEPMDYEGWTKMIAVALRPMFMSVIESIVSEGEKNRLALSLLKSDEPEPLPTEEPKTVNVGAVRSRRTTQWKRFDNYDLKNIISKGDGVTYFLPDSVIPNSETVRLNGGTALLTSDYTLSGNKLIFLNGDQSASQIEVRAQTK